MAGLVPAIHVFDLLKSRKDVDARHRAGHDERKTMLRPGTFALTVLLAALSAIGPP